MQHLQYGAGQPAPTKRETVHGPCFPGMLVPVFAGYVGQAINDNQRGVWLSRQAELRRTGVVTDKGSMVGYALVRILNREGHLQVSHADILTECHKAGRMSRSTVIRTLRSYADAGFLVWEASWLLADFEVPGWGRLRQARRGINRYTLLLPPVGVAALKGKAVKREPYRPDFRGRSSAIKLALAVRRDRIKAERRVNHECQAEPVILVGEETGKKEAHQEGARVETEAPPKPKDLLAARRAANEARDIAQRKEKLAKSARIIRSLA